FFNIIDENENGFITINEIESLFDNNNITTAYDILQDILDIVDDKFNEKNQLNNISIDQNDDEKFNNNHSSNEIFTGDETDEEEDNNDYINEHDDL
ncbi:unnamed protein product, partial [Rotaria sp. Silwood1]